MNGEYKRQGIKDIIDRINNIYSAIKTLNTSIRYEQVYKRSCLVYYEIHHIEVFMYMKWGINQETR